MARAVYTHDLQDPDFSWLISSFKENNPGYAFVEGSGVPLVFVKEMEPTFVPVDPPVIDAIKRADEIEAPKAK